MKGRKRKGSSTKASIRPVPAFQNLRGEVGYAAESGGSVHIALGSGGLNGADVTSSLAGLDVIEALADAFVLYDNPPIITVGDPTMVPLTQDILRRAYERHGLLKRYDPEYVRFVAPTPIAYAAGAANTVETENVTANIMIGAYGSEVSLIADAGARCNLPQSAAAFDLSAMGALYPATNRLAVGEDAYSAGAQMTRQRRYAISLQTQDIVRIFLVILIVGWALGELINSLANW